MPISFLAPVFLAGLAALAIPVLIHLANRPKKQVVDFPSLMFLARVDYRDASRRRLRNIVLFTLRALALVLVAAAFARPFIDRPVPVAAVPEGGREVVVLLDRSGSMAAGDRLDRARDAVTEVALGLRRGDRATLVAFDSEARPLHRATDQPEVLRRAAAAVTPGAGATRMAPALRLAESVLAGAPLPRRELVVISDFQRSGWRPEDAVRMPGGTTIRTVDVGAPLENVFVAETRFGRERFSGRDRVRVAAVVAARGAAGERTVPVTLALDGRAVATREVAVPPAGAVTVDFEPVTLPDRPVRGTVTAGGDAMPGDDRHHFVLSSTRALRVLVAEPRAGGRPFLGRALAVGSEHDVATVRVDRLDGAALAAADVVIVQGQPDDDALDRLEGWVGAGGGLVVVLGAEARGWSWAGREFLPGTLAGTRDAGTAGTGLVGLAADAPMFQPFRGGRGGLSGARFIRYRELEPDQATRVLARFGDGAPAVAERRAGRGRVIAVTSSLDGEWSDLVLQPGFVPLVHGLVRQASGRREEPAWRTVGDLLDAASLLAADPDPAAEPGTAPVLLAPSSDRRVVRQDSLYRLTEPGFYEVRDPRSDRGAALVAVNVDPSESEPARVDPAEVRSAIDGGGAGTAMAGVAREDRERRQGLWWYFLAGAFVLMTAETALSNGLSRRPRPRGEEGAGT